LISRFKSRQSFIRTSSTSKRITQKTFPTSWYQFSLIYWIYKFNLRWKYSIYIDNYYYFFLPHVQLLHALILSLHPLFYCLFKSIFSFLRSSSSSICSSSILLNPIDNFFYLRYSLILFYFLFFVYIIYCYDSLSKYNPIFFNIFFILSTLSLTPLTTISP
jgi:hypothetical protein